MNTPRVLQVHSRREEIPGTFTLQLRATDDQPLPSFVPGQFNMLYSFGGGEVPISFSGSARETDSYTHTIRALGKNTEALKRLLAADDIGVRGPFGRGWPMPDLAGKQVLVIAGGLGLAPLRPLIYHLSDNCQQFAGIQLFYGDRHPQQLLYRQELQQWSANMQVNLSVDQAGPDWHGHIGVITSLLNNAVFPLDNTIALVCGPEIMMRFSIQALRAKGLPGEAIHLSMERNMHCAIGHCGHCQWGPTFVCKDGPVFRYADIKKWLYTREL